MSFLGGLVTVSGLSRWPVGRTGTDVGAIETICLKGTIMTDAMAISSGLQSLKSAFEIGKALLQLGVSADISARISEMNERILAAQESAIVSREYQSTLSQQINDLKKHIVDLEAWETEAETYQLEDISQSGLLAYMPKPGPCYRTTAFTLRKVFQ
jgi:Zn-dependent M16 (insulinase) family peptidase